MSLESNKNLTENVPGWKKSQTHQQHGLLVEELLLEDLQVPLLLLQLTANILLSIKHTHPADISCVQRPKVNRDRTFSWLNYHFKRPRLHLVVTVQRCMLQMKVLYIQGSQDSTNWPPLASRFIFCKKTKTDSRLSYLTHHVCFELSNSLSSNSQQSDWL